MKNSPTLLALASCAALVGTSSTRSLLQAKTEVAKPLQMAATKPDLSSPEKTVRSFVAALNEKRFEDAALCTDGGASATTIKGFRGLWEQGKVQLSVSNLKAIVKGERGVVTTTLHWLDSRTTEKQTCEVDLVKRGARWLIVPLTVKDGRLVNVPPSAGMLSSFATILHSPEYFNTERLLALRARLAEMRSACSSNLKQIALGAWQLAQDEGTLKITQQNFKARVFSYTKTMQIFHCPSVEKGESYSFNGNLTNLPEEKLFHGQTKLVMFYEGANGKLDFRHMGIANVAFADGHVKAVTPAQAKTLQWKP